MKKLLRLMCLILALMTSSACAEITLDPAEIVDGFNGKIAPFFEMLKMDADAVSAAEVACRLTPANDAAERTGLPVYKSIDNHVMIVGENYIFTMVDLTDASTVKNLPQLVLAFSLASINVDDGLNMMDWMSEASKPFEGDAMKAYEWNVPRVSNIYLILFNGAEPDTLPQSVHELTYICLSEME